ncbi:MAG: bifunctional sugar-1-phosphate nucleotidylyltransferase/acetyltransferase [Methanoregula sp.]|jgi:glucose-1-phosphate thymidylyltransferase
MQAVILAAGEGKRVRPLTWSRPKSMIPVANRPIIAYVIDALVQNGIRDITVVVGYRKEQVTRYLNQLDIPIEVVVQNKQLGTAHALLCAKEKITGEFLLLPGDNYIDPQSIARIKECRNAILVREHPRPSNFGVVLLKDGFVREIVEKPDQAPGFVVSTGIYSLDTSVFSHITGNDMTDVIMSLVNTGTPVRAVPADDWENAIYPWDLLKLNERLLKDLPPARDGKISSHATISGPVLIGKGTTIGPNTVIQGPVVIGTDCTIGPGCCIMPDTSIGSRVTIEPFTFIKNSLVMDDTTISSHSRIADSVIGERCSFADHTSTETRGGLLEIEDRVTREEFGAIVGDNVKGGSFLRLCNCIVGNNATLEGNSPIITKIIPDGTLVM